MKTATKPHGSLMIRILDSERTVDAMTSLCFIAISFGLVQIIVLVCDSKLSDFLRFSIFSVCVFLLLITAGGAITFLVRVIKPFKPKKETVE